MNYGGRTMDSKNYEFIAEEFMWNHYLQAASEVQKDIHNLERKYQRMMQHAQEHHVKMLKMMGVEMTPDIGGKDL
ncbi:MAG: hypothetical protein NVS1B10_01470 [Candidatus Saccharimonadales bacterium]